VRTRNHRVTEIPQPLIDEFEARIRGEEYVPQVAVEAAPDAATPAPAGQESGAAGGDAAPVVVDEPVAPEAEVEAEAAATVEGEGEGESEREAAATAAPGSAAADQDAPAADQATRQAPVQAAPAAEVAAFLATPL